jgi:RNA polymerase sigma-70 factor, ECF subfamily
MEILVTRTDLAGLVRDARGGDRAAFGELVRRTQDAMVRTARALVGDHHEAEDAAQEAFVVAFGKLGQLRDPARFRAWIFRILTRTALARRRRPTARRLADGDVPARESIDHGRLDALSREVDRLPDRYRSPLSLHYLAGLTYRETAEALGISEKRVKSRLYDARALIRKRLGHGTA